MPNEATSVAVLLAGAIPPTQLMVVAQSVLTLAHSIVDRILFRPPPPLTGGFG